MRKSNDTMLPAFLVLNTFTDIGESTQFGRPYSVVVLTLAGLAVICFVSKYYQGLFKWIDKLIFITSLLACICECL
jgi:hypothetical protein